LARHARTRQVEAVNVDPSEGVARGPAAGIHLNFGGICGFASEVRLAHSTRAASYHA
jgi:hypothetical protein